MAAAMSETAVEKLPDFDDAEAAWGAMKLVPACTGLPMAVWITPNEGWLARRAGQGERL
jgi:hypothetical protein